MIFRGHPWYLAATKAGICRLTLGNKRFDDFARELAGRGPLYRADGELERYRRQLVDYFRHGRRVFAASLDLSGTLFQIRVWHELATIPYGETCTYAEVAARMGNPRAVRAAAAAVAANPIPILIPCHRVIGKGGTLVGFAGGLTLKASLLQLEGVYLRSASRIESLRIDQGLS